MRIRESLRHADFSIPEDCHLAAQIPFGIPLYCRKDSNSKTRANVVFEMTEGGFEIFHWSQCHGLKTLTKTAMNHKIISRTQQIVHKWCWIPSRITKWYLTVKTFAVSFVWVLKTEHIYYKCFLSFVLLLSHTFISSEEKLRKYSDKSVNFLQSLMG